MIILKMYQKFVTDCNISLCTVAPGVTTCTKTVLAQQLRLTEDKVVLLETVTQVWSSDCMLPT
jgi:hypothetical protein